MNLDLSYMDRVEQNSTPSTIFSKSWQSYSSEEFGSIFLPKSTSLKTKQLQIFDSAEIIRGTSNTYLNTSRLLGLENPEISFFSFSKNSKASQNKNKTNPKKNEILVFVEVLDDQNASVSFKFGKLVKPQIDLLARMQQNSDALSIQKSDYTLRIDEIKKLIPFIANAVKIMEFSLKTIGVEITTISIKEFEKELDKAFSEIPDVDGILFDAGLIRDENPKAWAHGDIEKRALLGTFSDKDIVKIYYGNWLRDYSSVLTGSAIGFDKDDRDRLEGSFGKKKAVIDYKSGFFSKPSQDSWLKIIELLAANEFVYKLGSQKNNNILDHVAELSKKFDQPTKNVVGLYRPEEHIDNPKALIDESILGHDSLDKPVKYSYAKMDANSSQIKFDSKKLYVGELADSLKIDSSNLKTYIKNSIDASRPSSLQYFSEQLRLAKKKGKNKTGFRHFGAALHVLEDFYAHSNFVEVALIKLGHTKVYPWVEKYNDGTAISTNTIDPCKIPIVTGYFGQLDVIASLSPKIAKEFFPTSYKEYKTLKPKDRTLMDELIIIILDDYIGKEKGMDEADKYSFLGFGYEEMKANYLWYLEVLDIIREAEQIPYLGKAITATKYSLDLVMQTISFLPNLILSSILNSMDEAVKSKQISIGPIGTDPSHTQIAKDHSEHHFNDLAGFLAYLVVRRLGKEMDKCWKGQKTVDSIINLVDKRYFVHPCDVDWIDPHIEKWATENPDKVKRGESKTTYEHGTKEFDKLKKDVDKKLQEYS